MGSPTIWYEKFLQNLVVPPPSTQNTAEEITFYALRISSFDFKELESGNYGVHIFFFDSMEKQFFGRQFQSATTMVSNKSLRLPNEVLFFCSGITENRVFIVCKIVKLGRNPWVVAWTYIPFTLQNHSLTDYGSITVKEIPLSRYQLYGGSCRSLIYLNGFDEVPAKLTKVDGVVMASVQTNVALNAFASFVPEFFITSFAESIPGTRWENKKLEFLDTVTAIVDNINLSYGNSSGNVEGLILQLLMKDYCQKLNKSVQELYPLQLVIIERRLKVGVHNGLCYIEEPNCLLLSAKDELDFGRSTLRRRSKSLSRLSMVSSIEFGEFIVRNCVKLSSLSADPVLAIVFSIDFLVGFRRNDGTILESQSVMVAWNAWSPWHDGSFTIADTVTVPLAGGPRPNPDDRFCMKNLLKLNDVSKIFTDVRPNFMLKFNFALIDSTNSTMLMMSNRQSTQATNQPTPLPNPDLPPVMVALTAADSEQLTEETDRNITSSRQNHGTVEVVNAVLVPSDGMRRSQSVPKLEATSNNMGVCLSMPQKISAICADETRVSQFPRAIATHFSHFPFPALFDKNEAVKPTYVDPAEKRSVNVEAELNAYLSTNEITIQFLGILNVKNPYYLKTEQQQVGRYFFTFQFYRFPELTTEMLLAQSTSNKCGATKPLVLRRLDADNQLVEENGHGFTVKFTVTQACVPPTDADDFIQYLSNGKLFVDVWDSDSLVHMGVCSIPLKFLCRHQMDAVYSDVQCPIVQSGLPDHTSSFATGLLYLRMANVGQAPTKQWVNNNRSTDKRMARLCQGSGEKFFLRARPLNAVHDSALQKFLSTQKLDLMQRKEELFSNNYLQRLQRWNEIKKSSPTAVSTPLKRFIFQEELNAYKALRNRSKASTLLRAVFRGITTRHAVNARYGETEFFEFQLQNTFAEQVVCAIDIADPQRLSLVLNADEWKFYKDAYHLKTPLERDLFSWDEELARTIILLNGMESVCVPFKFDSQKAFVGDVRGQFPELSEIRVLFKRVDTGEPIAILEVEAECRNFTVGASFRWLCEERRKVSRLIRLNGIQENQRVLALRCSTPNALCSIRNGPGGAQEILVNCHADEAPTVKTFLLMLYGDKYFSRLYAVWRLSVHAMQRLTVETIQAQRAKIPLLISSSLLSMDEDLVKLCSSSEAMIEFTPRDPFVANSRLLTDVQASFVPAFSGRRSIVITLIDFNLNRLLMAWLIEAVVCEPKIVKAFDVKIAANEKGRVISKTIELENAYNIPQRFRVHTSNEWLVTPESEYHSLAANSTAPLQLNFNPIAHGKPSMNVQVLVFVENAETNQQEEAYALKISYTN